jgi:hypothetical protein
VEATSEITVRGTIVAAGPFHNAWVMLATMAMGKGEAHHSAHPHDHRSREEHCPMGEENWALAR